MFRPLVLRAAAGAAVVWGVVTLVFLLLHAAPGDPAALLVGTAATPAQIAEQRRVLGLDRPLAVQYAVWVARFAHGDWGTSIVTGRPVRAMLGDAWPATARLVLLSLFLSYVLGIGVGLVQASVGGTRLDTALSAASVALFALPAYWLGLMLVMLFTYRLRWLPAFGAAGLDAEFLPGWARVLDGARHLALPLATLTIIGLGGVARFVRGSLL
ncbi:MAG TPA: ABC transporter permease, partial [Gemmatimonadales bacterium]|nr:ABC transporter permease [Gemmatimonadales bacterium]